MYGGYPLAYPQFKEYQPLDGGSGFNYTALHLRSD